MYFNGDLRNNNNLNRLMQRTGYNIVQSNGQRIYSLSDPIHPPPNGCEIYFGRIPRDIFEDELVPIFEKLGKIYQMRLMMDFNGLNRGFGFVTYFKPDIASAAVKVLNGFQVRPGNKMGVFKSINNCRLFVGGLPPERTKEEVYQGLSKYVDGIKDIIMYYTYGNKNLNRGFVFVEFYEHRMAAMARRKLCPGSLVLWGVPIFIEWADPIPEVDADILSKVKKLYIRNIDVDLNNDDLCYEIVKVVPATHIIKTHKILDYAFIHFTTRKAAEDAMNAMQGMSINGEPIEITWARPKCYSKTIRNENPPQHFCLSLPPKARKQAQVRKSNKITANCVNSRNFLPNPPLASSVNNNTNSILGAPPLFNLFPYLQNEVNLNMNQVLSNNNLNMNNVLPNNNSNMNHVLPNINSNMNHVLPNNNSNLNHVLPNINLNMNQVLPNLKMQEPLRFQKPDTYYYNPMKVAGLNDLIYTGRF